MRFVCIQLGRNFSNSLLANLFSLKSISLIVLCVIDVVRSDYSLWDVMLYFMLGTWVRCGILRKYVSFVFIQCSIVDLIFSSNQSKKGYNVQFVLDVTKSKSQILSYVTHIPHRLHLHNSPSHLMKNCYRCKADDNWIFEIQNFYRHSK